VHVIQQVTQDERMKGVHAEIHRERHAGLARRRVDSMTLQEQNNPEAGKVRCRKRGAKLSFVHPKAAGAAGTSSEEDVTAYDFRARQSTFFQLPQILDQVPDREVRRITEIVATVFFSDFMRLTIGVCSTAWIRRSCFQVRPPNKIVTSERSSAVKGVSSGRRKCLILLSSTITHPMQIPRDARMVEAMIAPRASHN
jgi:hypothetical protein